MRRYCLIARGPLVLCRTLVTNPPVPKQTAPVGRRDGSLPHPPRLAGDSDPQRQHGRLGFRIKAEPPRGKLPSPAAAARQEAAAKGTREGREQGERAQPGKGRKGKRLPKSLGTDVPGAGHQKGTLHPHSVPASPQGGTGFLLQGLNNLKLTSEKHVSMGFLWYSTILPALCED